MIRRTPSTLATLVLCAAIGACSTSRDAPEREARPSRYAFAAPAMGTEFRIVLFADDSTRAGLAAADAFDLADSLEAIMSDYLPESELNRLSDTAGSGRAISVSEPLLRILLEAGRVSEVTDGSFDVTTGALTRLWRRGMRRGTVPPDSAITSALATVGHESVVVDSAAGRVELVRSGARLDLGGIAKGFTADRMLDLLRMKGFGRALVDAGGDIAVGDAPPGETGWRIAIPPESGPDDRAPSIVVSNAGVATSGDRYRFVEADGRRYSHIVDPWTGYGTTGTPAVTVLAASAAQADAYASAFVVMTVARAMVIAESHPNLEARILSRNDASSAAAVQMTTGFPRP